MQKYGVWAVSAIVALAVFAGSRAIGLGEIVVLVLTAVGAIVGSILGTLLMSRLSADEAPGRGAPPGRGSGKTKA